MVIVHLYSIDNFVAIWKPIDHLTIQHKLDDKVINPNKGEKKDNKVSALESPFFLIIILFIFHELMQVLKKKNILTGHNWILL